MIKREFFVDEICYVLELSDTNVIMFYIDVHKSRHIDCETYDPFAPFHEDIKPYVCYADDLGETKIKHFFQIKKTVVAFVEEIAHRGVEEFSFGANEEHKLIIYRKVAEKIASKYEYYLYEIGHCFQFYKIKGL